MRIVFEDTISTIVIYNHRYNILYIFKHSHVPFLLRVYIQTKHRMVDCSIRISQSEHCIVVQILG